MEFAVLIGLALLVTAITARMSANRSHARLDTLERVVEAQRRALDELTRKLQATTPAPVTPPAAPAQQPVPHTPPPAAPTPPVVAPTPVPAASPTPTTPVTPRAQAPPPAPRTPPAPVTAPAPLKPPARVEPKPAFDWEGLIGVRLFAAVAGIALVIAAVFFLLYSIEHGWLQPKVRVAIGVLTAIALLVVCERKAARAYPATANALDAAAIAILFATFFSAHALWNLIPSTPTFFLLGLVTAVAVLLSIRRDSMFIAVLGLLGGFLTPALLSTGGNQPVALFSYLLLLNVGLAWVAYRKRWPVLTLLSAGLTTLYQWGWVQKFLDQTPLSLAMGIFLIFPATAIAGLLVGNPRRSPSDASDDLFEKTGLIASAVPLAFGAYLAAIPAYGAHAGLLFGFLFIVDTGLLAIALARNEERLHLIAGGATLLAVGLWLGNSYVPAAWTTTLAALTALVTLYALAPAIAARVGRPFKSIGAAAGYTAPLLLFAFAVLARTERGGASPAVLFAVLFALGLLVAWRAIVTKTGGWYFVAAFMVLAALGTWSAEHLITESLGIAVGLYGTFALFSLGVPLAARRAGRPLEPAQGAGIVLIASLGLLLFLALSPVAPAAIWGLALLLAIENAALFVESASGRMPGLSIAGGLLSWVVLLAWWSRAAAIVGVIPALLVVVLLSLVMLGGHAWAHARRSGAAADEPVRFRDGLFLGLVGQLFLAVVAANPAWAVPPWPLFGAVAVLTLATSVVALFTKVDVLHVAGVTAASLILATWAYTASPPPWPLVALVAGAAVSTFALIWIAVTGRRVTGTGAAIALFIGEASAILADSQSGSPWFVWIILAHAANVSAILVLAWRYRWAWVAPGAVVPAWFAIGAFALNHPEAQAWSVLLAFSGTLYVIFVAYPFVLGTRARESRDPYLASVLASGMFLIAAREALARGGLSTFVGIVPVGEGLVMALLLRQLLRVQASGARDLGRLAVVAGAALAFVTVAIPLQLDEQWITLGWALEGAALAWLCTRVPHRGLILSATALLGTVFVRLALNPAVFHYEPRGPLHILNWYLYTYAVSAIAMILAAGWLARAPVSQDSRRRIPGLLRAAGVILLFLLLNIEIADFYSAGPDITFQFSVSLAQDLTYTIGWLLFGLGLLAAGIITHNRAGRITALVLIALTTCKCFLFDLRTLGGLYRVGAFVGLAISLALVSVLLQKYVLAPPKPR